jgi:hypothetical protein
MFLAVFRRPIFGILPQSYFYGANNHGFVVNAPAFTPSTAANKAFVHFNRVFSADAIPLWPHHASPELVKQHEGRFVAFDAQLPLKLQGRLAGCLGCDQVGTPKPSG